MRPAIPLLKATFLLSGTALLSGVILGPQPARADCTFQPPVGDDAYVCDSGASAGGLNDAGGDNRLDMPAGGDGTVAGDVNFGAGSDTIEMHSGTITGDVDQGGGNDALVISNGTIAGDVQQGGGLDDFRMTGGEINTLNQGENLDTFFMSNGRIVDAFDDGDHAVMTGGRIGRVNMKLADNLFDMSGGTIDRNLVTGFGNDEIILSGGTIGGNISVSGGTDIVTVTGGSVAGEIRMSVGTDTFTWDGGGIIFGAIDLGGDEDTATLRDLSDANIGSTAALSGGLGADALVFENVSSGGVARFDGWETVDLTNDTELTFDGMLVLGDAGTGTGTMTIDATSTMFGGGFSGGISGLGGLANVVNSGRIDLTNGGGGTADSFTIAGDYVGDGGLLFLDTVLGDDSSASDRLVIDTGTASGTTGMSIVNAGGNGASTTADGILVVEALNGGTSASGAFALVDRVAAGAFEYFLFKGGVSAGTDENWYLRSTLVTPPASPPPEPAPAPAPVSPPAVEPEPEEPEVAEPPPPPADPVPPPPTEGDPTTPPVDPTPPVLPTDPAPETPEAPPPPEPAEPPPPPPAPPTDPAPLPGGAATPPTPGATPVVADVVPLYRIEVPTYSVVPPAAHHLALSTLGTFHIRRGEQVLLDGAGYLPASWARVFGQSSEIGWDGTVSPTFDGTLFGFQAGQDLVGWDWGSDHQSRLGLFVSHARMNGDIRGQALGWNNLSVGELSLDGTSLGGYWTHIGPQGWYLDAVLMGTWFGGDATSRAGTGIDIEGTGITASLEGGYPVPLTGQWTIEPQAQLIWQHLSLDRQSDAFSTVSFDNEDALTGRVGFRLQGNYQTRGGTLQPYLKANLWHTFDADQTVHFDADPIVSQLGGTSLELGAGIVANLTDKLSVFGTADYTTDLDGGKRQILSGNIGLRLKW